MLFNEELFLENARLEEEIKLLQQEIVKFRNQKDILIRNANAAISDMEPGPADAVLLAEIVLETFGILEPYDG